MEFIAVLAVIAVLCIVFRVSADIIIIGALVLTGLIILAMTLFFIVSFVLLLTSKKCAAVFDKIDKRRNGRFKSAFYRIGSENYPCLFPAEPKFVYKSCKNCKVRLNRRRGFVFDKFAAATCIFGLLFSIAAAGGAAWFAVCIWRV